MAKREQMHGISILKILCIGNVCNSESFDVLQRYSSILVILQTTDMHSIKTFLENIKTSSELIKRMNLLANVRKVLYDYSARPVP